MRFYEYRHIVSFQETNHVGNVYFTNHLVWQGRCREMFLRDHAPDVIGQLNSGLALVTVSCSCEYFAELTAFDEVLVRMRLAELVQNRMRMAFEYWRRKNGHEELVEGGGRMATKNGSRAASSRSRACGGTERNCSPRPCRQSCARRWRRMRNEMKNRNHPTTPIQPPTSNVRAWSDISRKSTRLN